MTLAKRVGSEQTKHGCSSINHGIYQVKVCDERKFLSGMATGVTDDRWEVQIAPGVRDRCRFVVDVVSQFDAGYSCRFRCSGYGKMILQKNRHLIGVFFIGCNRGNYWRPRLLLLKKIRHCFCVNTS
ncbi:uncharacterized protein LOC120357920 [Solenopsis invicta]|uniref:uncharacterized protein LOC120357920 n=1 Tax=Solenopsis invicta TaxID=13686 RepID=UPI00193CD99A|nr:uncharacterized protein LOC120357920 [Solenopsis invicta]